MSFSDPFFREAGSGPGVVCLHANASTSGQWRALMDLLAPRFHVLAADSLGAGKSQVRTAVQVIELLPEGKRLLDTFEVDAKSGATPGMAETMGAGAAAGHLATSAAVSVGKSVASEKFGDDVEADARRTADQISKVLASYFERQGWITAKP